MKSYTDTELIICIASRLFEDKKASFIGTGIPMLAASLARKLYAPNLIPIFEFGGVGAPLDLLPRAVGEGRTFYNGIMATGICDIMETAQRGLIEYGFLGAAQIDPYGNLNTTVIGSYESPKVRLPGSGGGCDVGSLCFKTIILMKHEKKRFVEKLDFMTTVGYFKGERTRYEIGLPEGSGPYRVVTDLCTLGFDEKTKRMMVLALNPGVSLEDVINNTGFELIIPENIGENPPPTPEELRVLREELDTEGFYLTTVKGKILEFKKLECPEYKKPATQGIYLTKSGEFIALGACGLDEDDFCKKSCLKTEVYR